MPEDVSPPDRHAPDRRSSPSRPRAHLSGPLGRLLIGLVVCVGLLTALPVGPVEAASGRRPTDSYTPSRVWQMKKNCVWAAGAMLVDKWTHGSIRVSQSVLRRASHDKKGGSSLYDLARGIGAVTGIRVAFSPGYGDTMAWWQLLDRLEHGGGAVLIGEYGKLPAHFTRWGRGFANRRNSSHAVYVQSYDRVHGRVWFMDPLADGHYPGEWIAVGALHRFATIEDGKVMAAATPARNDPRTAPLTDHAYHLSPPRLSGTPVAGATIRVQIGLGITAGFPEPAAQRVVAHWTPVASPEPPAQASRSRAVIDTASSPGALVPLIPVEASTASAPDSAAGRGFAVDLPVPAVPGRYRLSLGLAEVGHRTPGRTFRSLTVDVVAPYAGTVALAKQADLAAGQAFTLRMSVVNLGTVDWRTPASTSEGPRPLVPEVQTRIVLTWRSVDGDEVPAGEVPAEIAPGHGAKFAVAMVAPPDAGAWTLVVDVANLIEGSLASTGRDLPTMPVIVTPQALAGEP